MYECRYMDRFVHGKMNTSFLISSIFSKKKKIKSPALREKGKVEEKENVK